MVEEGVNVGIRYNCSRLPMLHHICLASTFPTLRCAGQMEWDTSKRCACYTPMFAAEHTETLAVYDKCDPAAYECKIK